MDIKRESKNISEPKGIVTLDNRRKLNVSGVLEVFSFDENKILLNTSLGTLEIKGNDLKISKLDVVLQESEILGTIDSFVYSTNKKKKNNNIIKKVLGSN